MKLQLQILVQYIYNLMIFLERKDATCNSNHNECNSVHKISDLKKYAKCTAYRKQTLLFLNGFKIFTYM